MTPAALVLAALRPRGPRDHVAPGRPPLAEAREAAPFRPAARARGPLVLLPRRPLPRRDDPRLSILKPLRGLDDGLEENLASFAALRGVDYEVVLSVADPKDPALDAVARVRARYPEAPVRPRRRRCARRPHREPEGRAARRRRARRPRRPLPRLRLERPRLSGRRRPDGRPLRRPVGRLRLEPLRRRRARATSAPSSRASTSSRSSSPGTSSPPGAGRRASSASRWRSRARVHDAIGGFAAFGEVLAEDQAIGLAVAEAGFRVVLSPVVVSNVIERRTLGPRPRPAGALGKDPLRLLEGPLRGRAPPEPVPCRAPRGSPRVAGGSPWAGPLSSLALVTLLVRALQASLLGRLCGAPLRPRRPPRDAAEGPPPARDPGRPLRLEGGRLARPPGADRARDGPRRDVGTEEMTERRDPLVVFLHGPSGEPGEFDDVSARLPERFSTRAPRLAWDRGDSPRELAGRLDDELRDETRPLRPRRKLVRRAGRPSVRPPKPGKSGRPRPLGLLRRPEGRLRTGRCACPPPLGDGGRRHSSRGRSPPQGRPSGRAPPVRPRRGPPADARSPVGLRLSRRVVSQRPRARVRIPRAGWPTRRPEPDEGRARNGRAPGAGGAGGGQERGFRDRGLEGDLGREDELAVLLVEDAVDLAAFLLDVEVVGLQVDVLPLDQVVEAGREGLDLVAVDVLVLVELVVADAELELLLRGCRGGSRTSRPASGRTCPALLVGRLQVLGAEADAGGRRRRRTAGERRSGDRPRWAEPPLTAPVPPEAPSEEAVDRLDVDPAGEEEGVVRVAVDVGDGPVRDRRPYAPNISP